LAERLQTETPDVEVMLAKTSTSVLRYLAPLALRRELLKFRPDVVHTHGITALLHTGPLALMRLIPAWVHTFHFGNYGNQANSRAFAAEAYLSRFATQLIAVSETQRESIIRRHRLSGDRIVTIPNGVVPWPLARNGDAAMRKRAELGFAPDDIVVGTIAVLSEQKGVTFLLQAMRRLVDRGLRARFVIVGGGALEPELRAEALALGLGSHVLFTGWREDGLELMPVLDVFVMSSLWEAMPMALLEAMAARRAIVVTDVGDNRLVVNAGECGIVVPPRNVEALADAIARLASDSRLRDTMGQAGCRRHQAHYSVDRMIAAYEDLYIKVAS
jgi:glycosyltransferase involved in cell wall biosynthesis